jgi:aurora kinase
MQTTSLSDYTLCRTLSEGKYSTVFRAREKRTRNIYVIKRILKQYQVEVQIHLRLAQHPHPHIINYYGVFEDERYYYIVLEYFERGDLFSYCDCQRRTLTEKETARIIRQIAMALHHCHQLGIIHRDIKPENVLISDDQATVKLCDFGWGCLWKPDQPMPERTCGTSLYLPPEMVSGKPHTYSADLWCLGVLLFELLMGVTPFEREGDSSHTTLYRRIVEQSVPELDQDLFSPYVRDVVPRLLHKRPEARIEMAALLAHPFLNR